MSPRIRTTLFAVLALLTVALAVLVAGRRQQANLEHAVAQSSGADAILRAMLDQETGLRGYAVTSRDEFLAPYHRGVRDFRAAVAREGDRLEASDPLRPLVERNALLAERWSAMADETILLIRFGRGREATALPPAVARKHAFDAFRAANTQLRDATGRTRAAQLGGVSRRPLLVVGGVGLLLCLLSIPLISRPAAREERRQARDARFRTAQARFGETLQLLDAESDTHELVKRHLEHVQPETAVTVLNRNNSEVRLDAVTAVAAGSPLADALQDAQPRDCLAVRTGRQHEAGHEDTLLECKLCGKTGTALATCTPLVVSGEVIGAVLVAHTAPLQVTDRRIISTTVAQAAPVIANLRNLAIAETRAATDGLTGLPNHRAVHDTLNRMVAQAGRLEHPLAAIALDLDHFKTINDTYGHDKGDQVLAALGATLTSLLRESDFAGRIGGEEFLVLAAATDREGAALLAEKLRRAVAAIVVPGLDHRVTASLGVAVFPQDGGEPDILLRHADRALYAAKRAGRNCVELAAPPADAGEPALTPA